MTNLGPDTHARGRSTLRVLGGLVLLIGVAGIVAGAALFAQGALSDDMEAMGRLALIGILLFGGGGVLVIAGLGVVRAGFRSTRYVPSEAFALVTDPHALFVDDQRVE